MSTLPAKRIQSAQAPSKTAKTSAGQIKTAGNSASAELEINQPLTLLNALLPTTASASKKNSQLPWPPLKTPLNASKKSVQMSTLPAKRIQSAQAPSKTAKTSAGQIKTAGNSASAELEINQPLTLLNALLLTTALVLKSKLTDSSDACQNLAIFNSTDVWETNYADSTY